jgi:uncharacterized membrane protein YbhN (UPF0104 family)
LAPHSKIGRIGLALVSVALLAALVLFTDFESLGTALEQGGLTLIAAAIALYLLNGVLKAFRWWMLLRAVGVHVSFLRAYGAFLVGMSINNLLPGGVAGEPLRLLHLQGRITGQAAGALTADRVLDAAFLAAAAAAGIPLLAGMNPDAVAPTIAGVCVVALLIVVVAGIVWRRWGIDTLARKPATGITTALLTIPIQLNDAVRLALIAAAYEVQVSVWRALVIVAIGTLAGLIAVLGGGAGIALTVGAMIGASGADPQTSVAIGLVFVATSTWLSYPLGALAALVRANFRRPPEDRWSSRWYSPPATRRGTSDS